ncbi:MAG: Ig-like domain-containing protein, partial [Acidobacteriota bacterium]
MTGRVTSPNGAGIAGSRVAAAGLGTANLSVPGGPYAVPAPAGTPTLTALHPVLGLSGSGQVLTLAKGQIATLDLVLSPTPPQIRALQPASGAADQPVGSTVSIAFSAAIDPASVIAATLSVSLADAAGAPTGLLFNGAVALSPDRTTVVFTPARPLPPGRRIAARFTGGVRDTAGTLYGGTLPVDWSFTTSTQFVTGGAIHPEKIRLLVPANGTAQIVGADGALPLVTGGTAPWSVWADVEGPICPSRVTQPANGAGGFTLTAGCPPTSPVTISSRVWLHVIDPTGAEAATFRLGPFTTPDGKGFVASPGEETVFTTAEGVEVTAPAGAFDVPTLVTVTKRPLDFSGVAVNPGLEVAAALSVDFDGTANETLRVRIPVATASPVGGLAFAGVPYDTPWGRKLRILDVGRLVDDGKGGKLISTLEADQPDDPPDAAAIATTGGRQALSARHTQAISKKLVRAIAAEFRVRADAVFIVGATLQLSALTGSIMPALVGANFLVLYSSLADALVFAALTADARYILPMITGKPFTLVARDVSTGWVLNTAEYGPINPDTARFFDLKTFPDGRAPIPLRILDGYPFRFYAFRAPEDGQTISLEVQLDATGSGGSTTLKALSPPPPKGTSLELCNLKQDNCSESPAGQGLPVSVAGTPGDELLVVVGPGDLEPEVFLGRPISINFNLSAKKIADADKPFVARLFDCGPIEPFSGCVSGPTIPLTPTLTASDRTLELSPGGLLPRGHVFQLVLDKDRLKFNGTQVTAAGDPVPALWPNEVPKRFWFATRAAPPSPSPEVRSFTSLGDTDSARDLMKFGNTLLVGSATGNLLAIDLSLTADKSVAPRPFAYLAPSAGTQMRAFATDGHNRLFVNELVGSSWTVKAIRVEDVWAATQGKCPVGAQPSGWQQNLGCFASAVGGVKVAFATGSLGGISPSEFLALAGSLPTGTPAGMQVLVEDRTMPDDRDSWEMSDFVARFGPKNAAPDSDGFFDLEANVESIRGLFPQPPDTVCNDEPYYKWQRISVDNLSTGQVFSADVAWNVAATVPHVRGRKGDRIRARFNRKAFAYVAIVGSGISVVDLNRFYERPELTSAQANKSQCGRRVARYEAADIPIYVNGVVPANALDASSSPRLDGLTNTPALAVSVSGVDIRVDSVLTHYGAVRSTSPQKSPEALGITPIASPNEWRTPADVQFLKKLLPSRVSVFYRDVLFVPTVAWTDRGIVGKEGGRFEKDPSPCAEKACENKKGTLLFYSLGSAGIATFDAAKDDRPLVGRFKARGHTVFRLAMDPSGRRLFAGGTDDRSNTIIDVWDVSRANGGPTSNGLDDAPVPEPEGDPRLLFSMVAPWDTNHLGFDEAGDGLVYTWGARVVGGASGSSVTRGGFALPVDDLTFTFAGVYRDPASPPSSGGQPGLPVIRPSATLRPLGVPVRSSAAAERINSDDDEQILTPAFKLRTSLPGALGSVLKARIQSLRILPDRSLLTRDDVGAAPMPPGGKGWPEPSVFVTLRRLGTTDVRGADGKAATGGALSTAYNLYESDEVVALVADPRAAESYRDTLKSSEDDTAGEGAACRRCRLPSQIDPKKMKVKDLLAGPILRAQLFVEDAGADAQTQAALDWFEARKDAYPAPRATVTVDAWADAVPSAAQATLAEPALNSATWQGEAGVGVALGPGEALIAATDFAAAGRGVDFSFERSYRSGALGYGPLGAAPWSASLFAHLRFIPPVITSNPDKNPKVYSYLGEVQYHDGGGRVFTFHPACEKDCPPEYVQPPGTGDGRKCPPETELDGGGTDLNGTSYCIPKGLYLNLQRLQNGKAYRIVTQSHGLVYFNEDGTLAEVSDRFRREPKGSTTRENTLRLTYDGTRHLVSAEDDYGRRYAFDYGRDPKKKETYGLLTSLKDFGTLGAQRKVSFEFDTADPESRRLLKVKLPEVDALQPGQNEPSAVTPEIAYAYDPSSVSASAPLHDKLGTTRLKSVTLPQFLDAAAPRFELAYDPATGRVKTLTVPNSTGALVLPYAFDPTPAPSHPFLASGVKVTPPWGRVLTYKLTPEGRIDTFENGSNIPTFAAPEPAAGFPSASLAPASKTPKTKWGYELDGRVNRVVAADGGETNLTYPKGGVRLAAATPSSTRRTTGSDAAGLSTQSSTVEITDYRDNVPFDLSVEMEPGKFHRLVLDVPGDPGGAEINFDTGWLGDGQKIVVTYDKLGRRKGANSPGVTGAPKVTESYKPGEDDPSKENGFPKETALGDVKWTNTYDFNDKRGNPSQVSTTSGPVTEYKYDAWDRVKSAAVTGSGNAGAFRTVPARAEQAFDAAGHLVRERLKQGGENVDTRYEYDAREQVVKVTRTRAAAPGAGEPVRDVVAVENDWDAATGLLNGVTRGQGGAGDVPVTTRFRYTPSTGRVEASWEESGGKKSGERRVLYDVMGRPVYRTDGDRGASWSEVDGLGRVFREALATGAFVERKFDAMGHPTEEVVFDFADDGKGGTQKRTLAKATSVWLPYGPKTVTTLLSANESDFRKSTYEYDGAGRETSVMTTGSVGGVAAAPRTERSITYAGDAGLVETETDAVGNVRKYRFTATTLRPSSIERTDKADGVKSNESYQYDVLGRVVDFVAGDGTHVALTYDELGNVTEHSVGDVTTRFTYDGWGNVLEATGPASGAKTLLGWDALSRMREKRVSGVAGRLDVTTLAYDELGRLGGRTRPGSLPETFAYEPDGMLKLWTTRFPVGGSQLQIGFDYDAANRLLRRRVVDAGTVRDALTPGFRLTDDADVTEFADGLSRLGRAARVTGSGATFPSGVADPRTAVAFSGYDLRGLPSQEAVGLSGIALARGYDAWGNATRVDLPSLVSA